MAPPQALALPYGWAKAEAPRIHHVSAHPAGEIPRMPHARRGPALRLPQRRHHIGGAAQIPVRRPRMRSGAATRVPPMPAAPRGAPARLARRHRGEARPSSIGDGVGSLRKGYSAPDPRHGPIPMATPRRGYLKYTMWGAFQAGEATRMPHAWCVPALRLSPRLHHMGGAAQIPVRHPRMLSGATTRVPPMPAAPRGTPARLARRHRGGARPSGAGGCIGSPRQLSSGPTPGIGPPLWL